MSNEHKNIDWTAWDKVVEEPLPEITKYLIVEQLKIKHRKRYPQKNVKGEYRKTYDCEKLYDDLIFLLNHLHLK